MWFCFFFLINQFVADPSAMLAQWVRRNMVLLLACTATITLLLCLSQAQKDHPAAFPNTSMLTWPHLYAQSSASALPRGFSAAHREFWIPLSGHWEPFPPVPCPALNESYTLPRRAEINGMETEKPPREWSCLGRCQNNPVLHPLPNFTLSKCLPLHSAGVYFSSI